MKKLISILTQYKNKNLIIKVALISTKRKVNNNFDLYYIE